MGKIKKGTKSTSIIPQESNQCAKNMNTNELNEEIREPTLEELKESEKPENILNIKSGRTKKKEKYAKKVEVDKVKLSFKDANRNKEYLKQWKNNRLEWKFEKLRQISIQISMFDIEKIDDTLWPIAVEYLSASKGESKKKILNLAEAELKRSEENEDMEHDEIISDTRYRRAREILQAFD